MILLLAGLLACATAPPGPPNILLVSMDTVRADHTSPYGSLHDTTPVLAALAREGAVFTHAFANGNESAWSHAALFTGRYASELAAPVYETYGIPPQASTIAEALHAYGYATAAFSAGGHVTADFGFDQGWDAFTAEEGFGSMQQTAPRAAAWISAEDPAKPWFVFLHAYDAHRPYLHKGIWDHLFAEGPGSRLAEVLCSNSCLSEMVLGDALLLDVVPRWFIHQGDQKIMDTEIYSRLAAAPEDGARLRITPADRAHVQAHYDGGIRYEDSLLGVTLAQLEAAGRLENTVVLLVSDHGEDLLDHGYMNHRTGLYDSCTRVPLVAWGPGFEGLGAVDGLVDGRDVAATVLALAGALPPAGSAGRDLRAVARGEAPLEAVFAEGVMDMVTVRTATHRLVFHGPLASPDFLDRLRAAPTDGPDFQLFDLQADPLEQVEVHLMQPETTTALRDRLVGWREGLDQGAYALRPEQISPAVARSLQEHGYWGAAPEPSSLPGEAPPEDGAPQIGEEDFQCRERFDFMPAPSPEPAG